LEENIKVNTVMFNEGEDTKFIYLIESGKFDVIKSMNQQSCLSSHR